MILACKTLTWKNWGSDHTWERLVWSWKMKPLLAVCRPTSGRTGHCRWNGSCDGGDAGDWPWPLRSPDRVRAEPSSLLSQGHRALHNKNVSEKKFFLVRTLTSSLCKLPVFVHQKKEKAEKKRQVSVPCKSARPPTRTVMKTHIAFLLSSLLHRQVWCTPTAMEFFPLFMMSAKVNAHCTCTELLHTR